MASDASPGHLGDLVVFVLFVQTAPRGLPRRQMQLMMFLQIWKKLCGKISRPKTISMTDARPSVWTRVRVAAVCFEGSNEDSHGHTWS